ncbi:MAG: histidine kinase [Bacteroidetes bacterium]|nr:histidine kinase [Bacteroidota bacterium]
MSEVWLPLLSGAILLAINWWVIRNYGNIKQLNPRYIPKWCSFLALGTLGLNAACLLTFVFSGMSDLISLTKSQTDWVLFSILILTSFNGIIYGLRIRGLMTIPLQTKNRLIQEQLLLQNVSQSQQNITLKEKVIETKKRNLRSQMNPHFLFNVLTGVQNLLQNDENEKAGVVFGRFKRILMLGFMAQDQILGSLDQEMEHLEQYLELERARISKPIQLTWKISDYVDALLVPCPLFILQPLVENAIWHGFASESVQEAAIVIQIDWQEEDLCIRVSDNGMGISKPSLSSQKHKSRGTEIIKERLGLLRHRGTLSIQDTPDYHPFKTGVTATIRLPLWSLEPNWEHPGQKKAG